MCSLQPDADGAAVEREMELVYRLYAGLGPFMRPEAGLGGKLLYGGEPDEAGCRLLRAANLGGAASLAASADAPRLRAAMRAGAVDFVVTSLDEALRIVKNEIRKRQPVAVGVSVAPEGLLAEMMDRGVQPDLLAPGLPTHAALAEFSRRGAQTVAPRELPPGCCLHVFPMPADGRHPPAAFEALLLERVAPEDHVNRRWVRLSPRYLGAAARRLRSVVCNAGTALEISSAAQSLGG